MGVSAPDPPYTHKKIQNKQTFLPFFFFFLRVQGGSGAETRWVGVLVFDDMQPHCQHATVVTEEWR